MEGKAASLSSTEATSEPPRPALKKFAEGLKSNDLTGRTNFDLNVQRVDEFIKNMHVTGAKGSTRQKSSSHKQLPGVYSYESGVSTCGKLQFVSPPTEFNSALGIKSRYGEGDGSFWDRWLGSNKEVLLPLNKRIEDERTTPNMPSQGFKRFYQLAPIDPPPGKVIIKPYAQRRSLRLGVDAKTSGVDEIQSALSDPFNKGDSVEGEDVIADSLTTEVSPTEVSPTKAERMVYFGRQARVGFFDFYRQALRKSQCLDIAAGREYSEFKPPDETRFDEIMSLWGAHLNIENAASNYMQRPHSPRSKFILGCLSKNILPRPELLLRNNFSVVLNLSHQRMGDTIAVDFANALSDLPCLEELNLCDNRLESSGIVCILDALQKCPKGRTLNLSDNHFDATAVRALVEYFSHENQALSNLSLSKIKLNDMSLGICLEVLSKKSTLVSLDISDNVIGSDEVVTVKKATATLNLYSYLESDFCSLQTLNLSWNQIRGTNAIMLGESFELNKSLTKVNLANNRLGEQGGEAIGSSLLANKTLKEIILRTNEITPRACSVLITGALCSSSLKVLDLSQNAVGRGGLQKYLFSEIIMRNNHVDIIMDGCNLQTKDLRCWFDWQNFSGDLSLNLSSPYDRVVAMDILNLTSNNELVKLNYFRASDGTSSMQDLDLCIESRVLPVISSKHKLTNSVQNFEMFKLQYLDKIVFDAEDKISLSNLTPYLLSCGIFDKSIVDELFALYDLDWSSLVERVELHEYFYNLRSLLLLRDASNGSINFMVDGGGKSNPYVPRSTGKIQCRVQRFGGYFHDPKIICSQSLRKILNFAKKSLVPLDVVSTVLRGVRVDTDDAQSILQFLHENGGDSVENFCRVLISAASPREFRILVLRSISTIASLRCQLKDTLKFAYRPLINLANGYYRLDLHNPIDRLCLERLKDLSNSGANYRVNLEFDDVSEHKNWSGFWNSVLDGNPIHINDSWFEMLPKKGRLEFDFVTYYRYERSIAISNQRFVGILLSCGICSIEQKDLLFSRIREIDEKALETTKWSAESYKISVLSRYPDLKEKVSGLKTIFSKSRASHPVLVTIEDYKKLTLDPYVDFGKEAMKMNTREAHQALGAYLTQIRPKLASIFDEVRSLSSDESCAVVSKTDLNQILTRAGLLLSVSQSEIKTIESKFFPNGKEFFSFEECFAIVFDQINGYRFSLFQLELVEETLGAGHITCSQLLILLDIFPGATISISVMGNFRVELVIRLYSRLIDPENFDIIIGTLSESEVAQVVIRLGFGIA